MPLVYAFTERIDELFQDTIPDITFTQGEEDTHDMTQYVEGYHAGMELFISDGPDSFFDGSAGVTFNGTHLVYDGEGDAGTLSGLVVSIVPGTE